MKRNSYGQQSLSSCAQMYCWVTPEHVENNATEKWYTNAHNTHPTIISVAEKNILKLIIKESRQESNLSALYDWLRFNNTFRTLTQHYCASKSA